jgi:4-amino-4-deoxy-L-arabinose transferase-like glycosyltransferase
MSNVRLLVGSIILLTFLVAGALYATLTPIWQAPDEPAHYNYIRFLATETGFPELTARCYDQPYLNELTTRHFPPELPITDLCYEFHQPPLYYLLATPIFVASNGSIVALRSLSVLLGAGVVLLAFFIAREIFPNRRAVAFGTMAFVAFVPMHVAILASVNNDALAELILASLLLLMVRRLVSPRRPSFKADVFLGVLLGLGLITKTTVYIAIPLAAATLLLTESATARRHTPGSWNLNWPRFFKHSTLVFGLALLVALPWYIRNAALYGGFDILGLNRHDSIVVGQLRTIDFLAEVGAPTYIGNSISTTFRSFWGQFGWMAVPMDSRTYLFLTLLSLIALGGFVAFLAALVSPAEPALRLTLEQGQALGLMALAILLIFLAYAWYNLSFVQFQGRYLFPGLIPLGIFFALGLTEALNRRWAWWLAGVLALALIWVIVGWGLTGGLDKWAVVLIGLALSLVVSRIFIDRHWIRSTPWLMAACYLGLIILTLASPFWFVVPYL